MSTGLQLAVVALLLLTIAPRTVRAWAGIAEPVDDPSAISGDPTPLWHLPLVCAGPALLLGGVLGGWDTALRFTGGCLLVGLAQAYVLEAAAARAELRRKGTLVRLPGSSLLRGTRLGIIPRR